MNKAKEKVEQKAEQKTEEALNKGVEKVEEAVTGKKNTKEKDTTGSQTPNTDNTGSGGSDSKTVVAGVANDDGEFIIKTTITCATGKTKMEALLREEDEVNSASIDSGTGKLYLSAGGKQEVYTNVIELIRANGFTADGKKPTKGGQGCQ